MIDFKKIILEWKKDNAQPQESENFACYKLSTEIESSSEQKDFDYLAKLLTSLHKEVLPLSYSFNLTVSADDYDTETVNNHDDIEKALDVESYSNIKLNLEIFKNEDSKVSYIFNVASFSTFLNSLDITSFLDTFENIDSKDCIEIIHWETETAFCTNSVIFRNIDDKRFKHNSSDSEINRERLISQRDSVSNLFSSQASKLLPTDFYIKTVYTEINDNTEILRDKFNNIAIVLVICFISDISSIEDNKVTFKIKGLKTIEETLTLDMVSSVNRAVLWQVYHWLVAGGSVVDKIGLIRNILSVHIEKSLKEIPDSLYSSISAGYELYLKDNVKQYIEVRNKISEFVFNQTDKAADLSKSLYNSVRSTLWTLVSFFISVVFLRALISKSNAKEKLFTGEIYFISIILMAASAVYFGLTLYEVTRDKNSILNRLDDIKQRYQDLIAPEDLKKIADVEELKCGIKRNVKEKRTAYLTAWGSMLILFFIAVTAMWKCF